MPNFFNTPYGASINFADMVNTPSFTGDTGWSYGGPNLWDSASKLDTSNINNLAWGNGFGSTGSSSQSPSRDPFGGLANAFRPASMGANPMAGFNTGEMIAGAMAMGAIQRSKDRMIDAYWNRAGNEMRKEFMLDDLFNIAPLAEQQKENLGQRLEFDRFRVGNALDATKDRKLREPGAQLSSPLATMIPRSRLNTPYGIG